VAGSVAEKVAAEAAPTEESRLKPLLQRRIPLATQDF
jgi:hypothetical protein